METNQDQTKVVSGQNHEVKMQSHFLETPCIYINTLYGIYIHIYKYVYTHLLFGHPSSPFTHGFP